MQLFGRLTQAQAGNEDLTWCTLEPFHRTWTAMAQDQHSSRIGKAVRESLPKLTYFTAAAARTG